MCWPITQKTRNADRRYRAAHASDEAMDVLFCLKIPSGADNDAGSSMCVDVANAAAYNVSTVGIFVPVSRSLCHALCVRGARSPRI
jgi:hypothetical protein